MTRDRARSVLERMEALDVSGMHGEDFLLTWRKKLDDLVAVVSAADVLENLHRAGRSLRVFDTGLAVSIFRDKSTRTRFSFASAANALGLALAELDEEKSQIAHGETVRETATMISFLTEVIGIRDDLYLGEGHRGMEEVGEALSDGFGSGVLAQRPAIVNLQCDLDHPTQTLADLGKLVRHFGSFEALRGKRIAMSWAYSPSYGKPLSVPQGIVALLTRFGMDVVLAAPEGYDLVPEIEHRARSHAVESGGRFEKVRDMDDAFRNADVVYPKSWAPLAVMERRTELLRAGDRAALADLEREALARNAEHRDWECDERRMKITRGGRALYLHCLPADISGVSCERGEVASSVFDRYRFDTYEEAGFKPFVIAAIILLARVPDPVGALRRIAERGATRLVR